MSAAPRSKFSAIVRNACPHCREGALYRKYLLPHERCLQCGYPVGEIVSGDGPAVLVMFLSGTLAALVTLWGHAVFAFEVWGMLGLWMVTVILFTFLTLSRLKTAMIFLEYVKHQDEQKNR